MAQQDPHLASLLKWSIENSSTTPSDPSNSSETQPASLPSRPPDPQALAALFGAPSDAELMKSSMAAIQSPTTSLSDKLTAFDNFEQLVENVDNANNLSPLGLWTPLIELLKSSEPDLKRMAAWCLGTAVQNNREAQERALVGGAVPGLVRMCLDDKEKEGVRRKSRYAVSSLIRNYQPGLDAAVKAMGEEDKAVDGKVDAGDMEAVDRIMEKLGR